MYREDKVLVYAKCSAYIVVSGKLCVKILAQSGSRVTSMHSRYIDMMCTVVCVANSAVGKAKHYR